MARNRYASPSLPLAVDVDGGLIEDGGHHLRRDEAHPDQPVKLQLVFLQDTSRRSRVSAARRSDEWLRARPARPSCSCRCSAVSGTILRAEALADQSANFVERVVGDARRIGTHVGDKTDRAFLAELDAFIQLLREHHGALDAEAELARRTPAAEWR